MESGDETMTKPTSPPETSRPGRLRVVVWNIAGNPQAWPALDSLKPDVYLLQEALVPDGQSGVWSSDGTFGRDGRKRPWTAVDEPGRLAKLRAGGALNDEELAKLKGKIVG